jgi:LacI family transcriptional regulator
MQHFHGGVTIRDVARQAGVSVSTVSRVLNDKDDVALETAAAVRRVIEELGYASSMAARSLRSRTTNVVGLIVPDLWHPFTSLVIRGVNQVTPRKGMTCWPTPARGATHSMAELGGAIGGAAQRQRHRRHHRGDAQRRHLSHHFPVVAIDPHQASDAFPAVIATNHQGVLEAMAYLINLGHHRIGFIAGRPELESAKRRLEGYHAGLVQAGITADPALIVTGDYTRAMGAECADQLLSLAAPPTAIMASSDETAFGVYDAAAARGMRIPDDLSVIGFDNTLESISVSPPLTTVDQSIETMGILAAQIVLKLIQGQPCESQLHKVATRLVVRQSCRAIVPGS